MTFYFHAIRAVDVVISAACAKIIRGINKDIRLVLIISRFPQFDYASVGTVGCFDEVHELPYCDYNKNVFAGLRDAWRHYAKLAGLTYSSNSVFFVFDDSEVACLNIYKLVASLRKKGTDVKLVHLVYVINPMSYGDDKGSRLAIFRSVFTSVYSMLTIGRLSLCKLVDKIGAFDRGFDFSFFDKEVFFFCKSPRGYESEFDDMPVPFCALESGGFKLPLVLADDSVVFLSDRLRGCVPDLGKWSDLTNAILKSLRSAYGRATIYIKVHPTDSMADYENVDLSGVEMIDRKESLEKILALNRGKVKAVYSFLSTGLFASASLGIPSYSLYPLLNPGAELADFFERILMRNNLKLTKLNNLNEIRELPRSAVSDPGLDKWRALADYLLADRH